ncbi:hypothetical protein AGR2A_Cc200119 [Agrobacterium genomosp. 2 str. CFBP 5494]|uniref:Uncharacterized protein n=1 Tax=Agrobacterium genomosp. 2 str. CFBP 5494 TaxID=1183436 RepID=A0A9W5B139_9HYPH|nr:hypothetical protein AGR2A_Cc200119 [Agrobacterium genomosp. 2 str. CFBP 5494]
MAALFVKLKIGGHGESYMPDLPRDLPDPSKSLHA